MKKERTSLMPKFTPYQHKIITSLVDKLAGSPSDVVSRIVMMWMKDNEEYIKKVSKG